MSTSKGNNRGTQDRREAVLEELQTAGRRFSDTAVFFHSAIAETLGLTPAEWKLLGLLQAQGTLTAGDFANLASLAPATISGMLRNLEQKGWIKRERDPEDQRRTIVSMAENEKLPELYRIFGDFLQELESVYANYSAKDLEMLSELMKRISDIQFRSAVAIANRG